MNRIRKPSTRLPARGLAGVAAGGAAAVLVVAATAAPASAAPSDDAEALGKFLGGQVASVDLDSIVELEGALAENPSGAHPTVTDPLSVSVLEALDVDLGAVQLLGTGGLASLGAAAQRAIAEDDGDAYAGSGAITGDGAIAIDPGAGPPANASLDLTALLPDTAVVEELGLELGALAATAAHVDAATPTSDYLIADAGLAIDSPLLGALYTEVTDLVDALTTALSGLEAALEADLDVSVVGLVGASVDATVTVPDLGALLPTGPSPAVDGITVDLTAGTVAIDLEAFLAAQSLDLNDLPPNTELLDGALAAALVTSLVDTVSAIVSDLLADIVAAVESTPLGVALGIDLLGDTASVDIAIGGTLGSPTLEATTTGAATLIDDILGALGFGSVAALVDGVEALLEGTLDTVLGLLDAPLDPATGIVAGIADEVVDPVIDLVGEILQLTVNVQPTAPPVNAAGGDLGSGTFTVRALSIGLLGPDDDLATLDLASATVRGTDVPADDGDDPGTDPADSLPPTGFDGVALGGIALLMLAAGAALVLGRRVALRG